MECIFCKVIKSEIPSYKIYEDEIVFVFLDINPDSVGHTLIIPKKHYQDLDDIGNNILNHLMKVSKKIKKMIEEKLNCDGITLIQNNGYIQEVKHFHLHLKPFYKTKKEKSIEEVYSLFE